MRSGLLIPLLLGSLGGCTLYFEDEGTPVDPGEPDPGPGPGPDPGTPPGEPTPSQQARALLAEWSGCMSLENFTTARMAPTWSQLSATNGGKCTNCHAEASLSFPMSSNAEAFFDVISEHRMPMLLFFGVDLTSQPGKVVVNLRPFESIGSGSAPYAAHPRFTVAGAPLTALTTFYDLTAARKAAGECDPPRLID